MNPWYAMSENINGIPVTRYIASWYIAGGKRSIPKIRKWLESLTINGRHLTNEEVKVIADCSVNGMFELEEVAKQFI